ncbi:MAG: hypothetical protein V1709_05810 [Planctomycetota bacterium]
MAEIVPIDSVQLDKINIVPIDSIKLDHTPTGNLEQFLPGEFQSFMPDYGVSHPTQPKLDFEIMPEPVMNGWLKAAFTVPTVFSTMAGTFPASGIKGLATFSSSLTAGKTVDEALQAASTDISEFMNRIPSFIMTSPEEHKALEILGLPFEYLEKAVTLSGEGWEMISNLALGKPSDETGQTYVAPVVATLLNAYFLGKLPEMAKDLARTPIRLAEIKNGAKRFQTWVDTGGDPVKQPIKVSEIGKEPSFVSIQKTEQKTETPVPAEKAPAIAPGEAAPEATINVKRITPDGLTVEEKIPAKEAMQEIKDNKTTVDRLKSLMDCLKL